MALVNELSQELLASDAPVALGPKVRLASIDAPETAQTPCGMASRNQLKAMLPLGSTVSLRVQALDRYGGSAAEGVGKARSTWRWCRPTSRS